MSPNRDSLPRGRKRELRFDGILDYFAGSLTDTGPRIAGRDVIGEIEAIWPDRSHRSPVRVTLGIEPLAEGPLWAIHGFGGTDVTPADPPEITIGGFNLLDRLLDLDGREVILIVEDVDG